MPLSFRKSAVVPPLMLGSSDGFKGNATTNRSRKGFAVWYPPSGSIVVGLLLPVTNAGSVILEYGENVWTSGNLELQEPKGRAGFPDAA
jgi:hypothetical protein